MHFLHLSDQRRKEIASLEKKKGRTTHRQMLVEGWRSVESAFLAGAPLTEVLIAEDVSRGQALLSAMKVAGLPLFNMSAKIARQISAVETHQGIIAVAGITETTHTEFENMETVIALDGLQDPGNVGTILRTAAWFGIEGIIAGSGTADFYNPKVVRASMGGIWDVKLARVNELNQTLIQLKETGFKLTSAELDGERLQNWQPANKSVLVIGSEANGVSDVVKSILDEAVTIVGAGNRGTESLNAGMAAGIIMYHWRHILEGKN